MGKREPCRRNLSGYWSRPVNDEQRLVCPVEMPTFSSPRAVPLMNSRRAAD
ncbi:type II toxin-antitoxin system YoeB family toxin [Aromatoleum anaerobium]|nr:type II toxin-antitoxin system YoeB family toxin [Aromatoleum anaerobium]